MVIPEIETDCRVSAGVEYSDCDGSTDVDVDSFCLFCKVLRGFGTGFGFGFSVSCKRAGTSPRLTGTGGVAMGVCFSVAMATIGGGLLTRIGSATF